jgi:hypothetical protein
MTVLRSMGEGHFADCVAPSGIGEPVAKRGAGGYSGDTPATPHRIRRMTHLHKKHNAARASRRGVLSAARARVDMTTRLARLALPSEPLVATRTLTHYPRPLDRYAALDEWHTARDSYWHGIESTMQVEPHREGRGTGDEGYASGTVVNAREVRGMPRWTGSKRSAITMTDEDGNAAPVDWTCYRVMPDGSRVPLVTTATARKRKGRRASASSPTVERDAAARERVASLMSERGRAAAQDTARTSS